MAGEAKPTPTASGARLDQGSHAEASAG